MALQTLIRGTNVAVAFIASEALSSFKPEAGGTSEAVLLPVLSLFTSEASDVTFIVIALLAIAIGHIAFSALGADIHRVTLHALGVVALDTD